MRAFIIFILLVTEVVVGSERIYKARPFQSNRISNGVTAQTGQFRYQVGLSIEKADNTFYSCGGALIAPTWILTAAHCIDGASQVYAFMENTAYQIGTRIFVLQSFIHENWDQRANDIALLRIPAFNLGPNIVPVALPPLNGFEKNYVYENVIASGWGYKNDYDQTAASELQYARMRVVPNFICVGLYGSNMFRNTNICARGQFRRSTCRGDSGGPLVTESTGVLIGITSYGAMTGCTKGLATAFTRVSSYRSWIKAISGV